MTAVLEVNNLSLNYPGHENNLLENINLKVNKGEIVAIVGLSGSGKTSLCYCLNGVIPHLYAAELSGQVFIEGKLISKLDIPRIACRAGMVFQNPETQLFFPLVEDELAFGPENLCIEPREIGKRIDRVLKQLGIEDKHRARTDHLSGGQKQLVALASVLTLEPEILIFDEVMSQIDKQGRQRIKDIIVELKEDNKTIIMVEHNLDNIDIADRKLLLTKGRLKPFAGRIQ